MIVLWSFILAGLLFILLFSWWLWRHGYEWSLRREPNTLWTAQSMRLRAIFVLVVGGGGLLWALNTDYRMRVTTLHEVMLPARVDGSRVTAVFEVEHANVRHTLFISPVSPPGEQPRAQAVLAAKLTGPDETPLLEEQRVFGKPDEGDYRGVTFHFTPRLVGTHRLTVTAPAPGVDRVHVLISDPDKRDGDRMPGY